MAENKARKEKKLWGQCCISRYSLAVNWFFYYIMQHLRITLSISSDTAYISPGSVHTLTQRHTNHKETGCEEVHFKA
jgi:hypothetical protein